MLRINTPFRKKAVVTILLGVTGYAYLKVWLPWTGLSIPCVFHEVTGLYCPGCGITRTVLSLIHGDLPQAFRFNMLVFVLAPMYLAYAISTKYKWNMTKNAIMACMLGLTLLFGILRNTPMFGWMAPTLLG